MFFIFPSSAPWAIFSNPWIIFWVLFKLPTFLDLFIHNLVPKHHGLILKDSIFFVSSLGNHYFFFFFFMALRNSPSRHFHLRIQDYDDYNLKKLEKILFKIWLLKWFKSQENKNLKEAALYSGKSMFQTNLDLEPKFFI